MHTSIPINDADLLARYVSEGDEGAFAQLVRAHEAMVIGAAWRRTGDPEMARDIAQQVFTTLAQKAWLLAERPSVAGWLHVAATHFAARACRAETTRRRRHEQAAQPDLTTNREEPWAALEEALAALGSAEREALVLHYLEDRPYHEMAGALGVNEAAVRKRVSRALEKLGAQLRRRGVRGTATGLLAGAAAIQTGASVSAMTGTALSLAAGGGSSLTLTLSTFMAHTAVKIAAIVAVIVALPIAWQTHANSQLRTELATLPPASASSAGAAASITGKGDAAALREELAALTAQLGQARRSREDAAARLAAAQRNLERAQQEVMVTFGDTKNLAHTVAGKMDAIVRVFTLNSGPRNIGGKPDPRQLEAAAETMKILPEILPLMQRIRELDNHPAKAAIFYSTLLGEVLKLAPEVQTRLDTELRQSYEQLKRDGLTVEFRPREDPKPWIARRETANQAVTQRVWALLTPEQRAHPFFKINGPTGGILFPEAGDGPFGMTPTFESRNAVMKAAPKTPEPATPPPNR
jgi:RNA polymerase sigma factor (sigma-70 family)